MTRWLCVLFLVGCGEFTINVEGATDDTLAYQALLFEGQCPADATQLGERTVITRVNLPRGGTGEGIGLGRLDQINYAVAVVGRDAMCRVRAFGCTGFEPGPGDRATVAVTSTEIGDTCPGREVCSEQFCDPEGDAGPSDASADASTDADAGPIDAPVDAPMDAGLPCSLEATGAACARDENCAPPFFVCGDRVCVPGESLSCEAVPVLLPRAADLVDVAIAEYLVPMEPAQVEVWAVSEGELFAGRLTSEMIDGTLMLREFGLAPSAGIEGARSWGAIHLARTRGSPDGVFDYGPTPYGEAGVPTLAWAGQLPYCGSQNGGVPDAVLFGTRDPESAPNIAFIADLFFWDDSDPDPMCRGDYDLVQVVTAVNGGFAAFADTGADAIAEIVPTTSSMVALHQRDGGVSIWNGQPVIMPEITPTIDLDLGSDVAPGWAAQSSVHRLVTSVAGALELRSVRNCTSSTCNVSEPTVIARGAMPSRLMLVELDGAGRVLLVLRDGVLDAMFLSDGNLGAGDPGVLVATMRLSADERIVDFDAFFDRDAVAVVGLDEDAVPHLYRLSAP